jgi:hypothetical protein
MMEVVRTSETSADNYFTLQYIPEDNSELHTGRRENLKSEGFVRLPSSWSVLHMSVSRALFVVYYFHILYKESLRSGNTAPQLMTFHRNTIC